MDHASFFSEATSIEIGVYSKHAVFDAPSLQNDNNLLQRLAKSLKSLFQI